MGYNGKPKVPHEWELRVVHYNPQVLSSSLSLVAWPAPFSQSQASKSVFSEHLCVGETKTANRVLQEKRTLFEACDWMKGAGHTMLYNLYHGIGPIALII